MIIPLDLYAKISSFESYYCSMLQMRFCWLTEVKGLAQYPKIRKFWKPGN